MSEESKPAAPDEIRAIAQIMRDFGIMQLTRGDHGGLTISLGPDPKHAASAQLGQAGTSLQDHMTNVRLRAANQIAGPNPRHIDPKMGGVR